MEDLSLATGIGTDVNFLNGNLEDALTLINAFINQDPIQFFQKLADLGGITFNDLPDNETNGYQLIEALETVVRSYVATTVLKGTVEKATTAEAQGGTADKFLDAALLQLVTATETRKGIVEKATQTETLAGAVDKFIDALLLQNHGDWQTPSYLNNHSDYTIGDFSGLRYRKLTNGMLQLAGSFERSVVTTPVVFVLPAGFRPLNALPIVGNREDNVLIGGNVFPSGNVVIVLDSATAGHHLDLNAIVPMDLPV